MNGIGDFCWVLHSQLSIIESFIICYFLG
uniref:Uncharacterized protein n=1 Tax=Rhizophora mucronata TaxID=61149 RepID=A0A2P2N235_RHIMU